MLYKIAILINLVTTLVFVPGGRTQETDKFIGFKDSLPVVTIDKLLLEAGIKEKVVGSLVIPGTFIAYGIIAQSSEGLKKLDRKIHQTIWINKPHDPVKFDDYLQYAPAVVVYGLNATGIKGKNNFRDRTIIYLMANIMMGITVQSIKAITRVQRPDGFGTNAFPSGHTATAFVGAEFLHQEYKSTSVWFSLLGYAMGTTTAYMRMYNNKHWFRDLLPGAGIGIIATKAAYWLYPKIKRKLFKKKPAKAMLLPYYQKKTGGLYLVYNFSGN